jgi:hypothetical protein
VLKKRGQARGAPTRKGTPKDQNTLAAGRASAPIGYAERVGRVVQRSFGFRVPQNIRPLAKFTGGVFHKLTSKRERVMMEFDFEKK